MAAVRRSISYTVSPERLMSFLIEDRKIVARIVATRSNEYDAFVLSFSLDGYEAYKDRLMKQMLQLAPNFISPEKVEGFIENDGMWIHTDYPLIKDFYYPEPLFRNAQRSTVTFAPLDRDTEMMTGLPLVYQGKPSPSIVLPKKDYSQINALTDIFSEHVRASSRRINGVSAYTYYLRNRQELLEEVKDSENARWDLSRLVWMRNKIPTLFNISYAKYIYSMFDAKTVLDPSAGWGDRLLGAAAAGVTTYHGIDPNTKMVPSYKAMISFVGRMVPLKFGSFSVRNQDFLEAEVKSNFYDMCFTSPPFYNYEIYSPDSDQSIVKYEGLEDWIVKFILPYVEKSIDAVKPGGIFALYMTDTSYKYPYIKRIIQRASKLADYQGVMLFSSFPLWVWKKPV